MADEHTVNEYGVYAEHADDALARLLRAWREDIDSEPFPVVTDVALPRQTRRRMPDEVRERPR